MPEHAIASSVACGCHGGVVCHRCYGGQIKTLPLTDRGLRREEHGLFDVGLAGMWFKPFCASRRVENIVRLNCNVTNNSTPPPPPPPSPPPPSSPPVAGRAAAAGTMVAWAITGGVRSFYSPLVHNSLLHNAILATGGSPRVFFSAALADDPKTGRAVGDGKSLSGLLATARGEAGDRTSCIFRYANLSAFLADHDEWATITAHVDESSERVPAETPRFSPACKLPADLAEDSFAHRKHSSDPRFLAQMHRWHTE